MSAVQGRVREIKEYEKQIGLFEANIVAVNPSREELEKLLGVELEKDPEYLKEDSKDGAQTLSLAVWLKEVVKGGLFKVQFYLKDTDRVNKDETKHQYINSIGDTSWADSEENLPTWFNEGGRTFRFAHVGEEELYRFLRSWLKVETRDPDAKLEFEWKKLMRGNVKEISDMIGSVYAQSIVALATIATSKDGEKEYQQVYNRNFLPGFYMKFFRLNGAKLPKFVEKFVASVEDPEYGCKDFYGDSLKTLHSYNPAENIAAGEETSISEDGPDL